MERERIINTPGVLPLPTIFGALVRVISELRLDIDPRLIISNTVEASKDVAIDLISDCNARTIVLSDGERNTYFVADINNPYEAGSRLNTTNRNKVISMECRLAARSKIASPITYKFIGSDWALNNPEDAYLGDNGLPIVYNLAPCTPVEAKEYLGVTDLPVPTYTSDNNGLIIINLCEALSLSNNIVAPFVVIDTRSLKVINVMGRLDEDLQIINKVYKSPFTVIKIVD
jgi:hypothetical protein